MASLRFKAFDEIEEVDLQALVADATEEDRYLEFKRDQLGNSEGERKEFLADVSSFANAAGGHIVFGMDAKGGVAISLNGLAGDADVEVLRLDEIIRSGLDPSIPGVRVRAIKLSTGRFAPLIYIPHSWAQPHMITYKSPSRFFARGAAGKYPMNVSQIRAAFVASESVTSRVRAFRTERLELIRTSDTPLAPGLPLVVGTPVQLDRGAKIVVHLVPLSATEPGAAADLQRLYREYRGIVLLDSIPSYLRFNFDGYLGYAESRQGMDGFSAGYVQVFRDGSLEAVDAQMLRPGPAGSVIPSRKFERELIKVFPHWLETLAFIGVQPPVALMVSLLKVRGFALGVSPDPFGENGAPIDRDVLMFPEILLNSLTVEADVVLRPVFDSLWNAAGHSQSTNYDNDTGRWVDI